MQGRPANERGRCGGDMSARLTAGAAGPGPVFRRQERRARGRFESARARHDSHRRAGRGRMKLSESGPGLGGQGQ